MRIKKMFGLVINILDFFLNIIGAGAVFVFLWVFIGVQRKTLFSKSYSLVGYKFKVDSVKGKQLVIDISK